jgi:hypothetical protein
MKLDIAEQGESHEEDQGGVEQDQAGLCNVAVVCTVNTYCPAKSLHVPKRTRQAENMAMATG